MAGPDHAKRITPKGTAEPPDPRIRFAAERTLLAWVRTGVALMGFGFVVARFGWFLREYAAGPIADPSARSPGVSMVIGVALIMLGVAICGTAGFGHLRFLRRFDRGEPYRPPGWSLAFAVAILLGVVGIGVAAYLLSLSPA